VVVVILYCLRSTFPFLKGVYRGTFNAFEYAKRNMSRPEPSYPDNYNDGEVPSGSGPQPLPDEYMEGGSEAASAAFLEEMQSSYTGETASGLTNEQDTLASQSAGSGGGGSTGGDRYGGLPDLMLLNVLCARAKPPRDSSPEAAIEAEASWQPVREWLAQHDAETVQAAVQQTGESGLTALHFACRNAPPLDVIEVFLSIAGDTAKQADSFGWLPIHYAAASGSDGRVIQTLADHYPESKTTTDRRGRTPLHFALGEKPASPDIIVLLSSSGAASYPDEIGMLVSSSECVF
jgi:hypothetical protein